MSNEPLPYHIDSGPSRIRTAAWVMLLVMGILYLLAGACTGLGAFIFMQVVVREGMPAATQKFLWIAFSIMGLSLLGFGGSYVWISILVKRRSKGAALVGQILTIVNAALIGVFIVIGIVD